MTKNKGSFQGNNLKTGAIGNAKLITHLEKQTKKLHKYLNKPEGYIRTKHDIENIELLRIEIKNGYHMIGKSKEFIEERISPNVKPVRYLPPSRAGKRVLVANLEPDVFDMFKGLAKKLNVSRDYLTNRAVAALFREVGLEMPPSGKARLEDSALKKPGRPAGRKPRVAPPDVNR